MNIAQKKLILIEHELSKNYESDSEELGGCFRYDYMN